MAETLLPTNPLIIKVLEDKAFMHLEILDLTMAAFKKIKLLLQRTQNELKTGIVKKDKRLTIEFINKGEYEALFNISSDTLIFILHSNIFIFDHEHHLWKTTYLRQNPSNAHCGMISVYNFLSDSFTFNRVNDLGYLIARIFINKDSHYYVEGKRQLGFLYNDFENSTISDEKLKAIIDSAILYSLDFDMYIPPFDSVNQITVQEVINANVASSIATGKRLGFRFQSDTDAVE
jgi:hypothetical protein